MALASLASGLLLSAFLARMSCAVISYYVWVTIHVWFLLQSLPEILTSSGVVKIEKQDISELGKSVENVDRLLPSEGERNS